jgi:ribosome maturation factor RimP
LDRELVKPADFVRFAGRKARLKLKNGIDGRKNFSGTLRDLKGGTLVLEVEGASVAIALENVAKARLVPEAPEMVRRKR